MSDYDDYSGYGSDESEAPPMERKVLFKGDGETKPKPGDTCTIHYMGKRGDGTVFDSSVGHKPFKFRMPKAGDKGKARSGESSVIQGFEMGVRKMYLGERALLRIRSDHAHVNRIVGGGDKVDEFEKGELVQVKMKVEGKYHWVDAKIRVCHHVDRTYDVKLFACPYFEEKKEAGIKSIRIRREIVGKEDNVTFIIELLAINGMYNKYGTYCGYPPEHWCTKLSKVFCCAKVKEYEPPDSDSDDSDSDDSSDDE